MPLLKAALASNEGQKRLALETIIQAGCRKVGVLGLTFKAGTDDLRESFAVDLIEGLVGKGHTVLAYDRNLLPSKLARSNLTYMRNAVPCLPEILRDSAADVISESQVVVIATDDNEFRHVFELASDEQTIIDLVGILKKQGSSHKGYHGICW